MLGFANAYAFSERLVWILRNYLLHRRFFELRIAFILLVAAPILQNLLFLKEMLDGMI